MKMVEVHNQGVHHMKEYVLAGRKMDNVHWTWTCRCARGTRRGQWVEVEYEMRDVEGFMPTSRMDLDDIK